MESSIGTWDGEGCDAMGEMSCDGWGGMGSDGRRGDGMGWCVVGWVWVCGRVGVLGWGAGGVRWGAVGWVGTVDALTRKRNTHVKVRPSSELSLFMAPFERAGLPSSLATIERKVE